MRNASEENTSIVDCYDQVSDALDAAMTLTELLGASEQGEMLTRETIAMAGRLATTHLEVVREASRKMIDLYSGLKSG